MDLQELGSGMEVQKNFQIAGDLGDGGPILVVILPQIALLTTKIINSTGRLLTRMQPATLLRRLCGFSVIKKDEGIGINEKIDEIEIDVAGTCESAGSVSRPCLASLAFISSLSGSSLSLVAHL